MIICKYFEITRTIYSNSERSEQLLVTEWFFRTIQIQIGKNYWDLEPCRKSQKIRNVEPIMVYDDTYRNSKNNVETYECNWSIAKTLAVCTQ